MVLKSAQSAWDYRQTVDDLPLFGPFWDRTAEIPTAGGQGAQFVEGAVNASEIPERDLSVQLSGWMLMEAAHATAASGDNGDRRRVTAEPLPRIVRLLPGRFSRDPKAPGTKENTAAALLLAFTVCGDPVGQFAVGGDVLGAYWTPMSASRSVTTPSN